MIKLSQERTTLKAMIRLYCQQLHQPEAFCDECSSLWEYAKERLEKCPYGVEKPTCQICPIHCYKPDMRERIREIIRYSGPRMILHHPVMAVRHLIHTGKTPGKIDSIITK